MKLSIDPKTLAEVIAWAARTLPARPTIPVLSGLLLDAADDHLTVSAFDYGSSARATVAADIAEPGRALLPGRMFAEVTKALPTTNFAELAATDDEATLICGHSYYTLRTLPVSDYPNLPEPPQSAGTIDADTLTAAVTQTYPAASNDDTTPMLTGIRLDTDGNRLTLAATDRYRIAVTDTTWTSTTSALSALIPGRHLNDIVKGLGHGPVQIALNDSMAAFTAGDRTSTVRLLDNEFIDYRARVDVDAAITTTIDAPSLAAAVKRVALVADRATTAIRLAFTADEVTVRAGDDGIGRGTETLECATVGDPVEIAFQSQYLLDALAGIDGQAAIGMQDPARPALFSSEDSSYAHLVMSLRLS